MPFYWKTQSAVRPYVLGISGLASAITVTAFQRATDWVLMWYWYVLTGVVLWLIYGLIANQLIDPINGLLIRSFGAKKLEKAQRTLAREIVIALFDRQTGLDLPDEDEDLVAREAALSFSKFFERM